MSEDWKEGDVFEWQNEIPAIVYKVNDYGESVTVATFGSDSVITETVTVKRLEELDIKSEFNIFELRDKYLQEKKEED